MEYNGEQQHPDNQCQMHTMLSTQYKDNKQPISNYLPPSVWDASIWSMPPLTVLQGRISSRNENKYQEPIPYAVSSTMLISQNSNQNEKCIRSEDNLKMVS